MSNTKDPLGILVEEPKNSDPLGILGDVKKKSSSNNVDLSSPPSLPIPILPGTGAQGSGSESGSPKYEYKWSDSQPLKTTSVVPHPTKITSKIGTVSQNTATAALAHPDLYSKKENREQYISTLDLPEDEKKQALAQFDSHAIAAEDIKKQNELIKKDPNNPDPQLKVIQNYISLGSTEQADKLADQVIASHPSWSPAYSYKAKIQADTGNYSFGIDILNKGIEQNPADPTLYNNRASIKSQSGDFQGAIQDIDTGLKFAKNPHLLENMWVQKAIIFKKLLDASDKPDAEKMIEQIYGKHDPHLDQTNKEFFLEKYQEAFNEANKYATANQEGPVVQPNVTPNTSANIQPMNELEAAKTLHNQQVVAGIQKSGLDTTQEKVKAQAELTNKIINPDKPLPNYVLEYAKEHGEQVVEGVKQFAKGADPELEQDLFKRSKITPVHQALDMLLGGATAAFGVASLTSPEVAGFNIAASAAPEKLNEWAFGSATSIADALGYKPTEGSIGEKALKTADLLVPLLVLHKAGKGEAETAKIETVEEKLKNGQELSKEDAPIIAEALKTEATNANLKDAIEASGKAEPIKTPAKEEIKTSSVEEKPIPAMENKVEPKINPGSKILSEAHPKENIDFAKQIIDDGWFNARGERMESRPDLGLSGAEIIKGIEDIKNDKNTVPAQKIINKLSEIKAKGEMPMIRGVGGLVERHGISLQEFEKQKQEIPQTLSEEDIKLADSIPDEAAKTINEFGITKDNIDEITKAWGFPKEEVEQIKQYLNESTESETASTTEATPIISESEKLAQATISETPKEPIRGQDKIAEGVNERARSLLNRVYEGKTPEEIKNAVEKHGLNYTIETHPQAERLASGFVKEVGIDNALEAVRDNKVEGGAAPFVWASAIDAVHRESLTEENPEAKMKLAEKEASLIDEFDKKSRSSGRFSSALQAVYQVSDLGYKLGTILNRAKDANNGESVPDILKERLADLSSKLDEVNKKMADQEKAIGIDLDKKVSEEVDKFVKTLYDKLPTERRKKADKAIAALEGIQTKLRSNAYSSIVPIPIIDAGISVIKKAIKAGVNIADAVELGINHIKERYSKNWERENDFRKDILDELKTQNIDLKKEPRDASDLDKYKEAIRKSIERSKNKLSEKDFGKKEKKATPALDKEAFDLLIEKNKLKDEVDVEIEKLRLKNRPMIDKVEDNFIDILNLPKSLMASADLSAPLRQGAVLSFKHPIIASKTMVEMFKQAFSEKKAIDWLTRLRSSPEYDIMKKAGLYVSEPTAKLSAKEEQFISNIAHKIPIWGHVVKGSERAYTGYLNKLRVDVFSQFHDGLIKQGLKGEELNRELESFADFVNNASGRGNLGRFEDSAAGLNAFFFSPRYAVSRFNLINPYEYYKMAPKARAEALKTLGIYIVMGSTVLALAKAGGAKVNTDPRSSDFGKIRIGDTRFDIWSGFQQWVRFISQFATGEKTDYKGHTKELGKGYKSDTRLDLAGHFLRSKASPATGFAMNAADGQDAFGNKVSFKFKDLDSFLNTEEGKLILPLYIQDLNDAAKSNNKGVIAAGAVGSFFGMGVSTYSDKKK